MVDKDDVWIIFFKWCAHREGKRFYAVTNLLKIEAVSATQVRMHQLIMGCIGIDHINGNGLDNRRSNLRIATCSQNNYNRTKSSGTSSRFRGVYFDRDKSKWAAQIKKYGKVTYLGSYGSEKLAAAARRKKEFELFGEFANRSTAL